MPTPPPPPPDPYISETAFSHRFQKVYTPPPTGRNSGTLDQKITKPSKSAKTYRVGAQRMSLRDILPVQEMCVHTAFSQRNLAQSCAQAAALWSNPEPLRTQPDLCPPFPWKAWSVTSTPSRGETSLSPPPRESCSEPTNAPGGKVQGRCVWPSHLCAREASLGLGSHPTNPTARPH